MSPADLDTIPLADLIAAVRRRGGTANLVPQTVLDRAGLRVDPVRRLVTWRGQTEELRSDRSVQVLRLLLEAYPAAVERDALCAAVWPGHDRFYSRRLLFDAVWRIRLVLPDLVASTPTAGREAVSGYWLCLRPGDRLTIRGRRSA